MPTGPDRIAVLALQLARTDRRALSQAWYDALHGAVQERLAVHALPRASAALEPARAARHEAEPGVAATRTPAGAGARSRSPLPRVAGIERDRQHAARLHAAPPLRVARPVARTVTIGRHRVRLLLRTDAAGTRVVAICSPADRERVARALAEVRVALARAGVTVAA